MTTDEEQEARAFDAMNAARAAFFAAPSDDRRLDWRMKARGYLLSAGVPPGEIRKTVEKIEAECQSVLGAQERAARDAAE